LPTLRLQAPEYPVSDKAGIETAEKTDEQVLLALVAAKQQQILKRRKTLFRTI
jgi:hypothetical protein